MPTSASGVNEGSSSHEAVAFIFSLCDSILDSKRYFYYFILSFFCGLFMSIVSLSLLLSRPCKIELMNDGKG